MMEWIIRYEDGSTFSNLDGMPWEAPRWGVMRVYYADDVVGVCVEESTVGFWGWLGDCWVGFRDEMGFWDYLGNHKKSQVVPLFGRTLPDSDWEKYLADEVKFITGLQKSAWRKRERRI